ncbi:MAG: helix-hairpin-helix domain-containing protein [Oscillospiraceae bacterium]|nr:helix-hairpin-helix domain-containing protein [Oscillospiraceae bacterium]
MNEKTQKYLLIAGCCVTLLISVSAFLMHQPKEPLQIILQETAAEAEYHVTEAAKTTVTSLKAETHTTTRKQTSTALETQSTEWERNLNLATEEDLQHINGIGEALSAAIVQYRSAIGGFVRRRELLAIPGIGEQLMGRIMAECYIPNEAADETEIAVPEVLPLQTETEPAETTAANPEEILRYNINLVTKEELLTIPDMTEKLADEILQLRQVLGAFQNVYELGLLEHLNGRYFEDVLKQYLYTEEDYFILDSAAG